MIRLAKLLHDASPRPVRNALGPAVRRLPARFRYGSAFVDEVALLRRWDAEPALREHTIADRRGRLLEAACRTARLASLGVPDTPHEVPWAEWPLMSKDDLFGDLALLTDPFVAAREQRHLTTSGSTAAPAPFVVDVRAGQVDWAYVTEVWRRVGVPLDAARVTVRAFRGQEPTRFDAVRNELQVRSFALRAPMLDDVIEEIVDLRPVLIHGFPSAVDLLVRAAGDRLRPGLDRLQAVSLSSEVLWEFQRTRIEEAFGVPVLDFYGLSERAAFADRCGEGRFHVAESYGLVELLDGHGRFIAEPGVAGEIVASSFVNRAMPLLRYRTGDRAAWAASCPCGRVGPVLDTIQGRVGRSVLVVEDGGEITGLSTGFDEFRWVSRFRWIQEVPGEADLLLEFVDGAPSGLVEAIVARYEDLIGGGLRISARAVDDIPPLPGGKEQSIDQRIPGWYERYGGGAP